MKFKQFDDGSCDIEFSLKERLVILRKGKLHLSSKNLKHFGNYLVKIVCDWNSKFSKEISEQITFDDTDIKTK